MKNNIFLIEGTLNGKIKQHIFSTDEISKAIMYFTYVTRGCEYKEWTLKKIGEWQRNKIIETKPILIAKNYEQLTLRRETIKEEKQRIEDALLEQETAKQIEKLFK